MKAGAVIGIVIAIGAVLFGGIMEGVPPTALIAPSAIVIIGGGTFGATMGSFGMEGIKAIAPGYKNAFSAEVPDKPAQVERLVGFADTARRDGLLALEAQLDEIPDEFTKKGLQLVVDGTDAHLVEEILHLEVEAMQTRHKVAEDVFRLASGYAPTIGVLGTVISLVHVLGNLSDPDSLGPAISVAFLATLMGVGSANILFLPVATRLKQISGWEVEFRHMTIEGILSLQAGENPRMVAEKLLAYVPPKEREGVNLPGSKPLQAVDQKAA
ncbi:MAG: MotA/TolQ/ExbB proton channel family protein [Patulibacter minatonensis]